jgi:hypothetical protein
VIPGHGDFGGIELLTLTIELVDKEKYLVKQGLIWMYLPDGKEIIIDFFRCLYKLNYFCEQHEPDTHEKHMFPPLHPD